MGGGGAGPVERSLALPLLTSSPSRFSVTFCGAGHWWSATVVRSPPPYPYCLLVRFAPDGSARSGQRRRAVLVSEAGYAGKGQRDGIYTTNWGWAGKGEGPAAARSG